MNKTPSTMSPLEAYEALMLFARRRGEGALRLAMHAAVPQSFRPDLLHLLKLNFLPRELHDSAAEADVLFSPLCEEVGRGYFEFGPHVRTLLLDNLAANYAADRTPRIKRVANFLLFYVEHAERRAAGGLDRLRRDYLEVQRWVALAFLDPDDAARQLAEALRGTSNAGGEFAARLRLGGLATALSSPLVKYRHVLNYAAGLQALEAGDHARARDLLSGLGDEEIDVGGVRLRPASELLRDYDVHAPAPDVPEPAREPLDETPAGSVTDHLRVLCVVSKQHSSLYTDVTRELVKLKFSLRMISVLNTAQENAQFLAIKDALLIFGTDTPFDAEYVSELIDHARSLDKPVLFLKLPGAEQRPSQWDWDWVKVIECQTEGEARPKLLEELGSLRAQKEARAKAREAEAGEAESGRHSLAELIDILRGSTVAEDRIRAAQALAGRDEIQALDALAETSRREKDTRVRLASVAALSKSRTEMALQALIVAAGDADAEVRRAAAGAVAAVQVNAVLIFGYFVSDDYEKRSVLGEELRRRGYVPLFFSLTSLPPRIHGDVARAASPLARFAIADMTGPHDVQEDIAATLELFLSQAHVPLVLISQRVISSRTDARLRQGHLSVSPPHTYAGPDELRESFDRLVVEPFEALRRAAPRGQEPPAQPPNFHYDIFLSHATWDRRSSSESQSWTDEFRLQLEYALAEVLGYVPRIVRSDPAIPEWFDEGRVAEEVSKAAVMVCLISPAYLRSERCRLELDAFTRRAVRTSGLLVDGRHRIFAVTNSDFSLTDLPPVLLETRFYQLNAEHGAEFAEPSEGGPGTGHGNKAALLALAHDITQTLRVLSATPPLSELDRRLIEAQELELFAKPEERLTAYDSLVKEFPDAAEAWKGRAYLLKQMERRDEAAESFRRSVDLSDNPQEKASLLFEAGRLLGEAGRFPEALEAMRQSQSLFEEIGHGRVAAALNEQGELLRAMGDYKAAYEVYRESNRRHPNVRARRGLEAVEEYLSGGGMK